MKKIVIYQVLPRLFGNLKNENIKGGSIEENGCGKFSDFTPGALKEIRNLGISHIWYTGIIEHAQVTDYSAYGIAADPEHIIKGKAGSPYAIKDYYDVDPDLAKEVNNRLMEFESLVERTHEAGMKVLIDFIPNHVARHYVSDTKPKNVKDFGEDDNVDQSFSPQNNFYYIQGESFVAPKIAGGKSVSWDESPAKVTGNNCMVANPKETDWYETVKLNYGINIFNGQSEYFDPIPDTWVKMKDILLYWAGKNVDGFRCDMAEMVPVQFWGWVIKEIKEKYPNIIFIAEVYRPELYETYIKKGGFDLLYDKVGMYDTLRGVVQYGSPVRTITDAWERISKIHHQILFFTENHDEQRLASDFYAGDANKGWPATFVSATINSNPMMIYFGQEIGERGMDEEGFSGLDGRTSIFDYWGLKNYQKWVNNKKFDGGGLDDWQKKLRDRHKKLLHFIKEDRAIHSGLFYDLMWFNKNNAHYNYDRIYSFLRYSEDSVLLVIVNFSDSENHIRVKIPDEAFHYCKLNSSDYFQSKDLMGSKSKIQFPGQVAGKGGIGLKINPYSGCIFKIK